MPTVCPCRWRWPNWRPWQRSLTKKRGKLTNDVRSVTSQRPWTSATLTRSASESDWFMAQWAYSYRLTMDHQMLIRLGGHQLFVHVQPPFYRNMFTSGWAVCCIAEIPPPCTISKSKSVCSISFWVTAAATWSAPMTWSRPSTATVVKSLRLRSDASFYSTMFSCVPHPISGKRNKAELFSFFSIKSSIHSCLGAHF